MTKAEEEAKQLVDKFRQEIYKGQLFQANVNPERERNHLEKAKQCALICSEMLITENETIEFMVNQRFNLEYWQQVKEAINNL